MKKAFLVLVMMAVCGNAYSAELLIQAKPHWLDSLTEKEVAGMDESTRQSYEARSKVGDVIAVRPDGWTWGKEEGLPNYIVVKVPMTVEEAQKYEEQLLETVQYETVVDGKAEIETTQVLKRKRKYAIPEVYVSTAKIAEKTDVAIASKDVTTFKSSITEKVGLITEIKPPAKDTIKTDLQSFYKKHIQKYVTVAHTFWVENSWAATQLKKTICPSGCDYTALETCMNANEQNLVTADKYFDVEISGSWSSDDTTAVVIHNYTTDATRYINIYTTGDARHTGTAASGYVHYATGSSAHIAVSSSNTYLEVSGIIFETYANNDAFGSRGGIASSQVPRWKIHHNIFYETQGSNYGGVSSVKSGGSTTGGYIYFHNNIVYDYLKDNAVNEGVGFKAAQAFASYYVYNNTFYGNQYGVLQGNSCTTTLKNNIANGNTVADYSGSFTSATNISEDNTSPESALRSIAVVFENEGANNFHIGSTEENAIDAGTDLGSPYNVDIDGVTRSGTWDIGADEYVSAGSPTYYPFKQFNHGIMTGVF